MCSPLKLVVLNLPWRMLELESSLNIERDVLLGQAKKESKRLKLGWGD